MEVKQTVFEEENFLDLIKGQNLFKANGSVHKADVVLADKRIFLLYFSANWCQACTEFTPILRDFYEVNFKLKTTYFKRSIFMQFGTSWTISIL